MSARKPRRGLMSVELRLNKENLTPYGVKQMSIIIFIDIFLLTENDYLNGTIDIIL